MLTSITNYGLTDIMEGFRYLLRKAELSEEVRTLAVQITQNGNDISAIYDWVKANLRYVPDPVRGMGDVELFISPARQVKDYNAGLAIAGDCDDFALLTVALCRAVGIRANIVLLDTIDNGIDHAIAEVYSEKLERWIMLDATGECLPLGWLESYYERIIV